MKHALTLIATLAAMLMAQVTMAAVSCPSKSTGQTISATDWNAVCTDIKTFCAYDGPGTGSNSLCGSLSGTDATLQTNVGNLTINAPTGKSILLTINGNSVFAVGASLMQMAQDLQIIDGSGNDLSVSGGFELDGTADLDGALTLAGTATLASTLSVASGVGMSGSAEVDGILYADGGVKFGGASNDTLSDFDEGTYTPTYFGSSTVGSCTYTTQYGAYQRIGNWVRVRGRVAWSACGTSPAGNIMISLPSGLSTPAASSMGTCSITDSTYTTTANFNLGAQVQGGVSAILLVEDPLAGGSVAVASVDVAADVRFFCDFNI